MLTNIKKLKYFLIDLRIISPKFIIINVFSTILSSLNSAISLLFFKLILDKVDSNDNNSIILFYLLVYALYLLISSVVKIIVLDKYNPVQHVVIQRNLQKIMFEKIKTLDITCYENSEFYNKYVRAMNETENRFFQIVETLMQLISGIVASVSLGILITTLNPLFVFFAIIMVSNTIIKGYKTNKYQYSLDRENTKSQRERNYVKRVFYIEQYFKELKLYPLYSLFVNVYERATKNIINTVNKYYKYILKIDLFSGSFNILLTLTMIYLMCIEVKHGKISISDFMVLFTSINNLATNLSGIFNVFPNLNIHSLYISNLLEVLNYKPLINETAEGICIDNNDVSNIVYKNVKFRYVGNSRDTLSNVNITIEQGKKIAIVGRNGSGKSTFVKLLLRLYDPQEGIVEINNLNYRNLDVKSLRSKFAVVFQDYNLYAVSIAENILMDSMNSEDQEKLVWEALKFSGLYDKVKNMKNGINTILTKEFDNEGVYLSGGEKQLISIARAYAAKASVLVFDEPSSSLDVYFEQQLFKKLSDLGKSKTVIYITHKLNATVNADLIYFFENGEITESGSHYELLKKNGNYKMMYETQIVGFNKE